MQSQPSLPPKPVSERFQPELTRVPDYTFGLRLARFGLRLFAKLLIALRGRLTVRGLENFPKDGPALIVLNHLGDADVVVIFSQLPTWKIDPLGAVDLHDDYPYIGIVGDLYGTIWLHRGRPDRRAIACALVSLERGRFVSIAPEGRESLAGGLEEGLNGAAFIALKADVPIIPVAVTGTESKELYNFKRLGKRVPLTMNVGKPFRIEENDDRHEALRLGTQRIMRELAQLLPPEYRGLYRDGR